MLSDDHNFRKITENYRVQGFKLVYTGIRVHLAIWVVAVGLEKNSEGKFS